MKSKPIQARTHVSSVEIILISMLSETCIFLQYPEVYTTEYEYSFPHSHQKLITIIPLHSARVSAAQRRRGLRRNVPDERGGAQQRQLPVRAARHLQVHVQNRHHLVPVRRPALRDEVRLLDVRRLSGETVTSHPLHLRFPCSRDIIIPKTYVSKSNWHYVRTIWFGAASRADQTTSLMHLSTPQANSQPPAFPGNS